MFNMKALDKLCFSDFICVVQRYLLICMCTRKDWLLKIDKIRKKYALIYNQIVKKVKLSQ